MKTWVASFICILCLYVILVDLPWRNKNCIIFDALEGTWQEIPDQETYTSRKRFTLYRDGSATGLDTSWIYMNRWEIEDSTLIFVGTGNVSSLSKRKSFLFKIMHVTSDSLVIYDLDKELYLYFEKSR